VLRHVQLVGCFRDGPKGFRTFGHEAAFLT
jgi:hypothetical protein